MIAKSELEKNLSGLPFDSSHPIFIAMITKARRQCAIFNQMPADDISGRFAIMQDLLGSIGEKTYIDQPFYCDYGAHIFIGKNCYIGMNCTFSDNNHIKIGNNVLIAGAVSIATASHDIRVEERVKQQGHAPFTTFSKPVSIGDNSWIGTNVTIIPGVCIGENCTIGAGSVVTRDIPSNSVAYGNPCRVHKNL
ncbi:MAG: sugar O-acetyltransferase [Lentisphaeria bacterium]